jgi:hypothetical protein
MNIGIYIMKEEEKNREKQTERQKIHILPIATISFEFFCCIYF